MQCQFVIHEQGTPLYSTLGCAVCCGRIERTHLMFNKLALSVSPQLAISGYILNSYYLSKILHTVCVWWSDYGLQQWGTILDIHCVTASR